MADLEFRIGELRLNPELIRFFGEASYYASHKFIVRASDSKVLIYSCVSKRHRELVPCFSLDREEIVGGGSLYIDKKDLLTLDDSAPFDYGRIPAKAALRFAELVLPELDRFQIEASGIMPPPDWHYMFDIHPFWDHYGY